jgi:predicted secreted hydrolase
VSRIELFASLALALLVAPSSQDAKWKRVEPGLALTYPADHGAHSEYETEWWYWTGQLADDAGARFGFQFTIFRRGLEPGATREEASPLRASEVYAGHLVLTDVTRGETRFAERLQRASPLAHASRDDLALVLDDWTMTRGEGDELHLKAADPAHAFGLEFTLHPEKPLVLHGERGVSRKGDEPGNASAYVSWTRLGVSGTLALDGASRAVRGSAWYDHEFGSSVLAAGIVGWDWFSLQLDDGRELMLFVLRDAEGAPSSSSAATLVARDGTTRTLARDEFTLRASGSWTSPKTHATYPAGWTIAIPSADLALTLAPLVADCELASQASTAVTYWEGPIDVRGSHAGHGYAELTGYAGVMTGHF